MPRAARKAVEPAEEQINNEPLDNDTEAVSDYRTGVVEGELELARSVAKRMGWTPKEDWKRDPTKWRDAPEFLENTPKELDALKERNRRTAQAAEAAIEDAQRRARQEAEAAVRAAAEAQDPDAAEAAARQLAKASGPPPAVAAWIARNEWFNTDPTARVLAASVTERLSQEGRSISEQLEGAEAEVKRRFPEHFGQAEPQEERREVPLRESRHVANPPAVQGGARGGEIRAKEKGFADIPAGDRALYTRHFAKRFEQTLGTPEAAQKKYAASYWANKGDA